MKTQTEKTQGSQNRSQPHVSAQKHREPASNTLFADNRPAATTQRKLQALVRQSETRTAQRKPNPKEGYETQPSPIHGTGLFANQEFSSGTEIGVGVQGPKSVTDMGKYVNHAPSAVASLKETGANYTLVADEDIQPGQEITADYAQANAVNPHIKPEP